MLNWNGLRRAQSMPIASNIANCWSLTVGRDLDAIVRIEFEGEGIPTQAARHVSCFEVFFVLFLERMRTI